jgi:hypothetical protein
MNEKLKTLILEDEKEFLEIFFEWLDNHDDIDITCMTDVIETLIVEIEEDRSRGDN